MKTLALNILDIIQNSVRAGAGMISVEIDESQNKDTYIISITDDGAGIPEDILPSVTDAFVTTRKTRKFGLGLPLLKYHSEITGGKVEIRSNRGIGTKVTAYFSFSHLDRQPLGDIAGVLMILIAANGTTEFMYKHRTDSGEYSFSTQEVREVLGINDLTGSSLLHDLKEMINENLINISASGLNTEAA